jgi:hypothetical protein
MRNFYFLLFMFLISIPQTNAQRIDFPVGLGGFDPKPESELKGPVRTVLTMEHRGDRVFDTTVENYSRQNRLIETMSHSAGIEIHSRSMVRLSSIRVHLYDSGGRLSQIVGSSVEGSRGGHSVFTYDSKNRLTEIVHYSADDKVFSRANYVYYPERREVEMKYTSYYEGRVIPSDKVILSYNEKNQWTRQTTYNKDGSVKGHVSFEYDDKGNLKKKTHCCEYNYWHLYTYKYDKHGNWIEQQDTYEQPGEGSTPKSDPDWMHTFRVITYYEDK